jgi:hypothetical protein
VSDERTVIDVPVATAPFLAIAAGSDYGLAIVAEGGLNVEDQWQRDDSLQAEIARLSISCSPNPFNPRTAIRYWLPQREPAILGIYDLRGRRVRSFVLASPDVGWHAESWDGRDEASNVLPTGIYLATIESETGIATCRMTLVR